MSVFKDIEDVTNVHLDITSYDSGDYGQKVNLAINIITEQSNKPLFLAVRAGFFIAAIAAIYILYLLLFQKVISIFINGLIRLILMIN